MTIDWWTLGLQAVNVLVLVWLLGRFFWRPVADVIAQRRAAAQQLLAQAQAKDAAAQAALAEIEATRAGFARERDAVLAAAHEAAESQRATLLQQATREADALRAAARVDIEKASASAARDWAERSGALAVTIAQRLAARLDGAAVRAAFGDWLVAGLHALPPAQRASAAAGGAALEVTSAAPLSADEQQALRLRIAQALGTDPPIRFEVDPDLIAGLELRAPHLVVANSWRADLDRLLAELTDVARS